MATQKSQKLSPKFSCKICDYITSKSSDYKKHLLSAKHNSATIGNGLQQKISEKFVCEICHYKTIIKCDYKKHLLTVKHRNLTNSQENSQKEVESNESSYLCEICSKQYITRSGLWRHKKKCSQITEEHHSNNPILENTLTATATGSQVMIKMEDLKEIINSLIESNNKHNAETQSKFLEMITASQALVPAGTNNSHNTNSHNTFNLQFFLNETCKNAMNVSEFVENIKIDFNDVENLGNTGYVKGITDIIMKNLHTLGITERPFHCTDTKRETIYIKDNDAWNKDTEEKTKFKAVLKEIANKNLDATKDWTQQHPDVRVLDSQENKMYLKLFEQVICVKEENNPKYHEKVIKNMMNSIRLDKNTT